MYLLNVPSVSSRYFKKNKRNVLFREIARLIARNSLVNRIMCSVNSARTIYNFPGIMRQVGPGSAVGTCSEKNLK